MCLDVLTATSSDSNTLLFCFVLSRFNSQVFCLNYCADIGSNWTMLFIARPKATL